MKKDIKLRAVMGPLADDGTAPPNFTLTSEQISFIDHHMECVLETGTFEVMVGSSSEDI